MTRTRNWRLTCLTQGELPPLIPAGMSRLPGADWSARTLDAFLTELDAGGSLPDAILAFGGADVIQALRRHDRTCALPVYLFAAADQPTPPGWDGAWSGDNLDVLTAVPERAAWIDALPALVAPLDSLRREHRFARWLAARGHGKLSDAEVFGLDAPRSTLLAWQRQAWVKPPSGRDELWRAQPSLRAAACEAALVFAPPPSSPDSARISTAPRDEGALLSQSLFPRKALLAFSAFLVALAALIWNGGWSMLQPKAADLRVKARPFNLRIGDPPVQEAHTAHPPVIPAKQPDPHEESRPVLVPAPPVEPAPAAPVRTIARGLVRRASTPLRSLSAGRVTALLAAPGDWLQSGTPLARLIDPRSERDLARLEQEMRDVDAAIEASSHDDAEARALAWTQSERERERVSGDLERAVQRAAQAQDLYARSLRLAEEGVISFREVRPDWDALQRAREAEAQARETLDAFLAARARPPESARGEAPAWLLVRRTRVEDELRTARSMAAPRLLRATEAGEFVSWRVAVGMDVEEGNELAQIATGEAWVEARLEAGDRGQASKIGEVELRLGEAQAWMPVTEFHELLTPGTGALLRALVPPSAQESTPSGSAAELRFRYLE